MLIKMSSALLTLSLCTSAIAGENIHKTQPPPEQNRVLQHSFFTDSQVTLSFKNYWKYLKEDNTAETHVHNAWGQGIALDYQSGYLGEIIGIDATYYGAIKLGASDYFNSRGVLYNNGSGNKKSNAEGFSKLGQRNIKLKYHPGDAQLNARWGWQTMRNYGVITSSTRLSPTTYSGWTGAIGYGDATLRVAWVENAMARNSPDKTHFTRNTGQTIDSLATADVLWKRKPLDVQFAWGESDNYLRRQILFATLRPTSTLSVGTQFYDTQALEDYRSMPASKRDFDERARHIAIDATWKAVGWSSKWGLGYTLAHKADAVGFYPRHMSKNSRGTFTSMASAGEDYLRDKEVVLSNITDYQLTSDLTVGLMGNIAQFNYQQNHVRTGEINVFGRWVPADPDLKNLTVWAMFGPGWSYKAQGKTPVLTNGRYTRIHTLGSEVIIEYRFRLF